MRITDGSAPPFGVRLTRDDQTLQTLKLSTPDSLLIDEGLLPNQEYTYKAYRLSDARISDSSTQAVVTTMDTTSHDWVFDPPVLLGDGSSSVLYDVAIINDTLAYAVGEIYKRDSLGNWDPQPYNLARWDGSSWSIQKVPYYHQGQPFYSPIRAVFAFNANDIWFGIGNLIHWNGQGFISVALPSGVWGPNRINKIWGHDGEIWIVGDGGSIAHRSASGAWRRVESGTATAVLDVWGMRHSLTGKIEVYCVVSSLFEPGDVSILKITDQTTIEPIPWAPGRLLSGVWTHQNFHIFTAGDGVFQYRPGGWRELDVGASIYSNRVRGSALNNILVVGDFGLLCHWNGTTWRLMSMDFDLGYSSVAVRENLVVAVGQKNGRGGITAMRRE